MISEYLKGTSLRLTHVTFTKVRARQYSHCPTLTILMVIKIAPIINVLTDTAYQEIFHGNF